MRVLVVNAGSSSLKLSVLDDESLIATEALPSPADGIDEHAVAELIAQWGPLDAVGHRIVHGGEDFTEPVLIDDEVRRRLGELVDLAPIHLPKSLVGLDLLRRLLPTKPAVACFDTAFHATMPAAASTYALPEEWRVQWPLRRFGFHGLSHAYAARQGAALAGRPITSLRVVTCHLGAGASLAAVQHGVSVDTTMGFTPLDGLVMATRSGSVDPGLLLWLEEHVGMAPSELARVLEHRSGLLGLSGTTDMATIIDMSEEGDENALLALAVYTHRLRAGVAAMAAAMNGLDLLVFTGGVGERAPAVRHRAGTGLGFLGVGIDSAINDAVHPDAELSAAGSVVRTFVVTAREDLQIVRDLEKVLAN